jgi:hypothetical protein
MMWIILGIIGFIALLICVILCLPVKIILKNDENNALILRYKFLFKTFGEDPDPNDPIVKMLKTAVGADRLDSKSVKSNIQKDGLQSAVTDSFQTLIQLLKEALNLLQFGKITRLHIQIRCAHEDADEAAVQYGWCCAAVSAALNILRGFLTIGKRGQNIDIGCDFAASQSLFRYDVVLSIRFSRILSAFWRIALAEAKRAQPK